MTTAVYQPPGTAVPETALAHAPQTQIVRMGMDTIAGFEALQRAARLLAAADIVPEGYRGKVADCAIVLDIALRLQMSPILIMQNLYVVKGKPGWAGKFAIAVVNNSGLFSPLNFEWKGKEGEDAWGCRAVATRLKDGKILHGTWIDMKLVKAEGWWTKKDKNGNETSKWQSMPAQMFPYRAAAFWLNQHYPEGLLGLPTSEEIIDVTPAPPPVAAAKVVELPVAQVVEPQPVGTGGVSPSPSTSASAAAPEPDKGGALSPGVDPAAMEKQETASVSPVVAASFREAEEAMAKAMAEAPAPKTASMAERQAKGVAATREKMRAARERIAGPAHTDPPDEQLGLRAPAVSDYRDGGEG